MSELTESEGIRKLRRLTAMSPREIAHRVREKLYSQIDRISLPIRDAGVYDCPQNFKSYLAGEAAHRFYRGHRDNLRTAVERHFPQWIEPAVDEAERLCRHEVTLLGYDPVALGRQIDWHRDPITGKIWEKRYWADYRPVQDSGGRDPKIIYELNRHQHLPRLAKAFLLTGDERYAAEAVGQLNSWIDQNPPGLGINWQSSLEIGIRAISWLWTIFPLLSSRSFDEASAQRVGGSLFAQLEHVHRYTSLFSSPNTHLIGEAAALFIAGLVFHDQKRPSIWLRRAVDLLREASEKQVLDDGVYGELSSCYHCYALDFYLQALVLAEQHGFHLPDPVPQKIRAMLQFLMHLTRPDGTLPSLGDDDGGRALALARKDYHSFQDGLCIGAILYRRGDFKHQARGFCEEALWMLGEDGWNVYRQLEVQEPAETQSYYPCAGYLVQRSGWGMFDSHLVFDCGGLGMLTGAHAHADALSVTLFGGGRELLVDPGTFVYNCAPEWRSYFRSTPAHNTVTIDGRDQAEQGDTFHWKTKLCSRTTRELTQPGLDYVEGEHDGYRRMPQGVTHRRRVLYFPPEYWIIVDDFRGSGEHTFGFHYHFAPDIEISGLDQEETGVAVRAEHGRLRLRLIASQPVTSELIRGETAPIAGWASRGYGQKQPCSTLRATLTGSAPAVAITFLVPPSDDFGESSNGSCDPAVWQLILEGGDGIASAFRNNRFMDIIIRSDGNSDVTVADFRMRGEFFWLRLEGDVLTRVLAEQACSLDQAGTNIFRRAEPGPYYGVFDLQSKVESLCVESVAS